MRWEEEAYSRKDENGNLVSMEEYEAQANAVRTGFGKFMTRGDIKLYLICGVGFFLDAYDLFIINLVNPFWTYEYWGGLDHPKKKPAYPPLLRGAVNAGANIGNVFGQILFGFLGDSFGRKFVYGKELIIAMVGVILIISLPNSIPTSHLKMWYLFAFRILMGIGIGGDYPMSAAIVAERSTLQNRGRMLALIFSNQGWGTLAGSIVTLILLACFSKAINDRGEYGQIDAIWRLQIGLILVPCLAVLYFRLTMPESRKFLQSGELSTVRANRLADSNSSFGSDDANNTEKVVAAKGGNVEPGATEYERKASVVEAAATTPSRATNMRAAFIYFSEWRHLRTLLGTASTWFLVDVAFYGLNLNQSIIISQIGFSKGSNQYHVFLRGAIGNLIIAAAGYVPGYFFTAFTIEWLGRRWIQMQGFFVTALMFAIIAGKWKDYTDKADPKTGSLFALFTIAQLFFNFGANATTFIVPAEVFPSRVRGFAHGVSAATGKLGAILAGILFNYLSQGRWGVANVLWAFFAFNMAGLIATFFLVPETTGIDADAVDFEETQEAITGVRAKTVSPWKQIPTWMKRFFGGRDEFF